MKSGMFVIALLAAASTNVDAQVRARSTGSGGAQRENGRVFVTQRNNQNCAVEIREYQRQRALMQQQLRREHQEWHARHNNDRDYVRAHNALHDRLERASVVWERRHATELNRCDDNRSRDRWESDNRWDNHDWDDRRYNSRDGKYDDKLEKLDEKREKWQDKRVARERRSN